MRKHVKPVDPAATIPDPSRAGFLPPGGLPVEWSVHWARLEMRGDIVVSEVEDERPAPTEPRTVEGESEAAKDPPAGMTQEAGEAVLPTGAAVSLPASDPKAERAPGAVASVPFMITAADRKRLKALGRTDDEIKAMKPEEAQAILAGPDASTA